ncbi:MAG: 50S ribosomal protein L18 [Candidatus Liptonbacteria bacterium RIFCSPLOWO2_01_FULL_52_25]|uniref:Large ribosomal subunit protein uL18 n=1 Tax=Candidatus Liptonbacteria bacterium RIFCSPLOWO2_01_FULL_52_25 TaxID=1798650 RepID=A0A1G2CCY5_9BACT|nr:MAG: 50S ribosomal protein L18 [Candidatus Liptonbacteria bacterium RIFCSPLOWO2_01_FULL_52_25]
MNIAKKLNRKRIRRIIRTRAKIFGTVSRPRLAVARSNRFIYAQLIDDASSHTLAHASSRELKEKKSKKDGAKLVGELLAKRAVEKGIKAVVFDRREYKYHGRVQALAEGARSGGLKF